MNLPPGVSEKTFLDAVHHAVRVLAPRFAFGIWGVDDLGQECVVWALDALPRFDPRPDEHGRPTRPLENFIFSHLKRRLINHKRNKLWRADCPCPACKSGNPCTPDGPCKVFLAWRRRNEAKSNIQRPLDLACIADENEPTMRAVSTVVQDVAGEELLALIDRELPVHLREAYLRLLAGEKLSKKKRLEVQAAVRAILERAGVDVPDA